MDPMDRLREMILPLYKNYSTVQRRVIVAQNIAKFTMGRQEMTALQLQSALRNGMGVVIPLPDVVAAVDQLPQLPRRGSSGAQSPQRRDQSTPEFATIRNIGLVSNSRSSPSPGVAYGGAEDEQEEERRFRLDDLINALEQAPAVLVHDVPQMTGLRDDPHPPKRSTGAAPMVGDFAETVNFPVNKRGPPLSPLQIQSQLKQQQQQRQQEEQQRQLEAQSSSSSSSSSSEGLEEAQQQLTPSRPPAPRPSAARDSPRSPNGAKQPPAEFESPQLFGATAQHQMGGETAPSLSPPGGLGGGSGDATSTVHLDCDSILGQFREALLAKHKANHGSDDPKAIWRLRMMFKRDFDKNQDSVVDQGEFIAAIEKLGLGFTRRDAQMLFLAVDQNMDGSLNPCEFIDAIRGGAVTEKRRAVLEQAFRKLDRTGDGELTIDDLRIYYGEGAKDMVLENLMTELKGRRNGIDARKAVVSREEFYDYYDDLTAHMDEEKFEQLIRNSFHLEGNTTDRRVYVTFSDGRAGEFVSLEDDPDTGVSVDREDQVAMVAAISRQLGVDKSLITYVDAHSAGQGSSMRIGGDGCD